MFLSPQRRLLTLWWLGLVLVLLFVGPPLLSHFRNASDPNLYAADVRIYIFPLFRFWDSPQFQSDYLANYLSALSPSGFVALYWALAKVGIDPMTTSRFLSYPLLGLTAIALGGAALALRGRLASVLAIFFVLGNDIYLTRMVGGLQRAFGYFFVASALAALAHARPLALAAIVIVSAGFYPVSALIAGMFLVILVLGFPQHLRGKAREWKLGFRLAFVGGTALLAILPLLAVLLRTRAYGPAISPKGLASFPEAAIGGRYSPVDVVGSGDFLWQVTKLFGTLLGENPKLAAGRLALFLLTLVIFCLLARKNHATRRVLPAFAVVPFGFFLSQIGAPFLFLPERYVTYLLPLLVHLCLACGASYLWQSAADLKKHPIRWATFLPLAVMIVCFFASRVSPFAGLNGSARPNRTLLSAIAATPPHSVIAGWPGRMIDDVPYIARRRVLVSAEAHQAFHQKYLLEMRERMNALVDAYFATSRAPLEVLRERFAVTHLLLDLNDLFDPALPQYFRPFDTKISAAKQKLATNKPALLAGLDRSAVARDGSTVIVDLARWLEEPKR